MKQEYHHHITGEQKLVNQIVASNLAIACLLANQMKPDASNKDIIEHVGHLYADWLGILGEIRPNPN